MRRPAAGETSRWRFSPPALAPLSRHSSCPRLVPLTPSAVLGVLGIVFAFGVTTMLYGAWQVRAGSRSRRAVLCLLAVVGLLWLIAMAL